MSEPKVPGMTIEYPCPEYQGYTSPSDEAVLCVAYLVDSEFRQAAKKQIPSRTPEYETFYADMALMQEPFNNTFLNASFRAICIVKRE